MRTELSGDYKDKLKFPHNTHIQSLDKEELSRKWYESYFIKMQKKIKFYDNVRIRAMAMYVENLLKRKHEREQQAEEEMKASGGKKKPKKSLTAPKVAYAINILKLALEENNYKQEKFNKLLKYDENVDLITDE